MLFTQNNIHETNSAKYICDFKKKATEHAGIAFRVRPPEGRTAG